jgi:peroxiredoxin
MVRDGVTYYKLYPINESQPEIKATIKQKAASEIEHFEKEGQLLPAYKFTDITGKAYSSTSTKGKVVVIKCWYIGCVACVKEFPEVNKLVDGYKDRDDILFISLAIDGKEDLTDFLKGNELKYATVPHMKDFMQDQLGIGSYPTHILLDRAGKIVKVVDSVEELKPFLEKQAVVASL